MAKRNRHNKSLREQMVEQMLPLLEKANLAEWLESRLHMSLTNIADEMFGNGNVTREERITLSGAIGVALDAYHKHLQENAAQLFQRRPWDDAPGDAANQQVSEADEDGCEGVELIESDGGMFMPLIEKAVRADGTIPVKIIKPGWGSSGYYPAEVLERDGAKVFTKGLKMYWNHQTPSEEAERPEGDLNSLAAELTTDARYQANGQAGAGLYADAKVFEAYKQPVDDMAKHIGVSIRAFGKAEHGEAEGREGAVITELTRAKSVDFVTAPGAGGQILSLFEAARTPPLAPPQTSTFGEGNGKGSAVQKSETTSGDVEENLTKEARMDELELKKLQEANATLQTNLDEVKANNARMQEALALRDAKDMVREAVNAVSGLPDVTKARLIESLAKNPPMKDGALDSDTLAAAIQEAVKAEVKYLEQVAGVGNIRGLGESADDDEQSQETLQSDLEKSFAALGLSEAGAKIAAKGRV